MGSKTNCALKCSKSLNSETHALSSVTATDYFVCSLLTKLEAVLYGSIADETALATPRTAVILAK